MNWTLNRSRNALQLQHTSKQILLTLSFRHGDNAPLFQLRLEQCATPLVQLPQRGLNRIGSSYLPPCDKFEACILAKLAAIDQGFWWGEHKDPEPELVTTLRRSEKSFWLVYFEAKIRAPGSSIFACIDQNTGETEIDTE